MTSKDLMQAMGQVDESLVEEAAEGYKRKPFPVFMAAGIAACLCLMLMTFFWKDTTDTYTAQETIALAGGAVDTDGGVSGAVMDGNGADYGTYLPPGPEGAATGAPASVDMEQPSLVVQAEYWEAGTLYATVHSLIDTNVIPVGTKVQLRFSEECMIAADNGLGGYSYTEGQPMPDAYPQGSLMQVQFYHREGNTLFISCIYPVQ